MKKDSKIINNKKNVGVLYIRYDKNTLCGQVIERLKQTPGRQLNDVVLNLVFLSELVEPLDWHGIDLDTLNCAYYESLKLFSDKLIQARYKINNLSPYIVRQKYQEVSSYSVLQDTEHLARTFKTFQNDEYY